jgi:hypothetical protein
LGKRAFELEMGRVISNLVISDEMPRGPDLSRGIKEARAKAERGDYLGAIHVLGDLKIEVAPGKGLESGGPVEPADVEQALGDLRRAIKKAGLGEAATAAKTLCEAARDAARLGHWDAAHALIDEADQRLSEAGGDAPQG